MSAIIHMEYQAKLNLKHHYVYGLSSKKNNSHLMIKTGLKWFLKM